MIGTIQTNSFFLGAGLREAYSQGTVSFQPAHLHNGFIRKIQVKPPNIFIGTVSSMDKHGYCKTSLSALYEKGFIEHADRCV